MFCIVDYTDSKTTIVVDEGEQKDSGKQPLFVKIWEFLQTEICIQILWIHYHSVDNTLRDFSE